MTRPEPNRSNRKKKQPSRRVPAKPASAPAAPEPADTGPTDTESTNTESTDASTRGKPSRSANDPEPGDGERPDRDPIDSNETEPGMANLQTDLDPLDPRTTGPLPTGGLDQTMQLPRYQPPLDEAAPSKPAFGQSAPAPGWSDRPIRAAGSDRARMPPIGDDVTTFFLRHRRQMITLLSLMILFVLVYVAVGQLNLSGTGS